MNKTGYKNYQPLLRKLLALLKHHFGKELLSCVLFGSVARGDGRKHSDIDIIIVYKNISCDPFEKFWPVLQQLREDSEYKNLEAEGFTPEPFPVFLSEEELAGNPQVLLDVTEEGIILLDRGRIFRRRLDHIRRRLKELGSKRIFLPDGTWYWDLKPDWKPGEEFKL